VRLPGFDRSRPWECTIRVRAGRGPELALPTFDVGIDGLTAATRGVTNEYQDVVVTIPPQPQRDGLVITMAAAPTFVPGPGDRRELGVQIDRIACEPRDGGLVLPPRRAIVTAAVSGAAFGAAFGVTLPGAAAAAAGSIVLGAAQSLPLAKGPAPYSAYQERAMTTALWIAGVLVVVALALRRIKGAPLAPAARFVLAFSAAALFLHLLALLHPLKSPIDVIFHAHRFQGVLAGNYFFTQPMPSGVRFPYAVALYVFTIPWASVTQDYVALLRIVVSSWHVFAGGLLYVLVVRLWRDDLAAAIAVVLFHFVPLPYIVIGNANMTFAFGQSVATVVIVAAATWRLAARDVAGALGLLVLAAVAFLSHVGVFPYLFAAMFAIALVYWLRGGPPLRAAAAWIVIVAAVAAVLSVVVYYGRFEEAYRTLDRVRGADTAAVPQGPAQAAAPVEHVPRHARLLRAMSLLTVDMGWPVLLLGAAGLWRLWPVPRGDRLKMVLSGLALTYGAFVAFAVAVPVEPSFQRYADEFISRIDFATAPAIVVVAALGFAWAWRAGAIARAVSAVVLVAAAVIGVERWLVWF
jgi:hypothetical protein